MALTNKILLLDDDSDLLVLYQEMLNHLPSKPEIRTATSGARAITLLESEPFSLLLCDLQMPRMDGLQVLTIVRRKFPQLRTAVMTAGVDEQVRSRAYAIGIDLFLEKPNNRNEIRLFLECVESLLGKKEQAGFRGIQSKSLVDLIQLECLSQSTSTLKITNGTSVGQIWLNEGEIVDAEALDEVGEQAFKRIMSWKTGNFEILPPDLNHTVRIKTSYQGLLLDSAQAMDEAASFGSVAADQPASSVPAALEAISRTHGVDFAVFAPADAKTAPLHWGTENPIPLADWARTTAHRFQAIGTNLELGELRSFEAMGLQQHLGIVPRPDGQLLIGLQRSLPRTEMKECLKNASAKWQS
jgi:CheY-like chemotaxis protein